MVAYSFQRQFVEPIRTGRKTHTIRGPRRRHAGNGEALQLYASMRTKSCFLIARAICRVIRPIDIHFSPVRRDDYVTVGNQDVFGKKLNAFAYSDGFDDWEALRAFWEKHHGLVPVFQGVIIYWKDMVSG